MKPAVLIAVLAGSLACSTAALAHERYYGGYYGGHGHGGYAWVRPGPRYYYPYSVFAPPYYIAPYYPVTVYAPRPPIVVERYYVEAAPPAPPPSAPPQYSREERSYAKIAPPERPAPRFERMTLSAKELFAFDEATLHSPQPRLDEIADALKKNPEIDQVSITGYTDRIGSESYNAKLSQRRADAVKSYLVNRKGVAANRLVAIGKGESNPVVQCHDEKKADLIKCLEPNRRVEVEEIVIERRVRERG